MGVLPSVSRVFDHCRRFTRVRAALTGVVLLTVIAALAIQAPPALANDTAVGGVGGLVYPLESTDIRMEAETVQAVCYRSFAEFRIDFKFLNEGDTQVVKLGFPFAVTLPGGNGNPPVAFRAWQDGKPLAVTLGRGVSQDDLTFGPSPTELGYFLHEATFPRGETTISVNYLALPSTSSGSRSDAPFTIGGERVNGWQAWYTYWVHTGAGWKGTIDKSVVRFSLADNFGGWGIEDRLSDHETTKPDSYVKIGERSYQWVYTDYEPTDNDDVRLNFTRFNYQWLATPDGIPESFGPMPMADGRFAHWKNDESGFPVGWEAVDSQIETFWEVGPRPKDRSFQIDIATNNDIRELRILPGRHDTLTSFAEYGRPKSMRVTLSDGTSEVLRLEDEPSLQRFALTGTAEWIEFEVLDSYPGTKSGTTYVSEIDLDAALAPTFLTFDELISDETTVPASGGASTSATTVGGATHAPPVSSDTTLTYGTSAPPDSVAAAGPTPPAGSISAASGGIDGGRLLWPAWLGLAVALLGLCALVYFVARLRRAGRPR